MLVNLLSLLVIPSFQEGIVFISLNIFITGQGKIFQMIQCCVFGDEITPTSAKQSIFPCFTGTSTLAVGIKLACCTLGMMNDFLIN